ncbi:MAG: hypothetical protein LKF96_11845 [Treponema sp.]|jgi:predicted transcriptional regulator|nr:hypothetical protein [Treponema sp.]
MTIAEIAEKLDARIVCHEELRSKDIKTGCGSDMMSDVMAFYHDRGILVTGLVNIQVVRTASLLDLDALCFVRGKKPNQDMIDLADESGIVVLETNLPMLPACGILYAGGIKGNEEPAR